MPNNPQGFPPLPQDFRDLLIRLDQRTADGFDSINKKLDRLDGRADSLDIRVRDIETELADRARLKGEFEDAQKDLLSLDKRVSLIETTASNATTMVKAFWAVLGTGVAAVGFFILKGFFGA